MLLPSRDDISTFFSFYSQTFILLSKGKGDIGKRTTEEVGTEKGAYKGHVRRSGSEGMQKKII